MQLRDINAQDEASLKRELPSLFAPSVEPSVLDEAIRLLMAKGTYETVSAVRSSDGNYELVGKSIHPLEAIEIRGNHKVEETALRELLDFKVGDRFDRRRVVNSGERFKNYYAEHGFFDAIIEISFEKGTASPNGVRVIFEIQEKSPCLITGLDFQTANVDLKEKLDSHFKKIKRQPLSTDLARRLVADISEFLISERYLSAEVIGPEAIYNPAKTEAQLKFEIREPYRWEFYMDGFQFFTLSDLYHALDLQNHERKNVDPAGEGADRIRRGYLDKGFPHIQIEVKVINPKDTYLKRVYYTLNEGPRVHIRAVEVQGRTSRAPRYYENFITNNSSDIVSNGYYNRQDIETGLKNLVTELRNQGFLKAKVLSSRTEFNEKRDQALIHVLIEEGPQTQLRALEFEGNKFISSYELAQVVGLETNSPLYLKSFEEGLEKLKSFYRNQGFLEMRLLNESEDIIQYNEKGTQARILFRIYEGPRIRVNKIVVEGNTITKSYVILREAGFETGEVLTPYKLDWATGRLNRMGLFSRVDIHTLEEGTAVSARTLVITVADRDPGVFNVGAGVTNERNFTVRGFSGFNYSNLGGTGRGVSIRGELKQNVGRINFLERQVTTGYLEPFLFETRTRGRINVTSSEHVFEYDPGNDLTKITTTNRMDLLAEREIAPHTKLTWKVWSLEYNKYWERHGRCIIDPVTNNPLLPYNPNWGYCSPSLQQVGTLGPTLDFDYRDNAFLPTKGSFTRFVVDYSHPKIGSSSGIHFVRTEGNYTHYTRLGSPRWVWTNSLRGGYVANLDRSSPDSGVPTNYAFLLGGINTVRGFDMATYADRIPKQGDDGFVVYAGNQRPIKWDSHYYLIKSEIRFPIYGDHGGVIFYDGARVDVSGYHFQRPYRDAVGFGYRYNTPVGPIALDLAFKIRPLKDETPFRVHFSIGTF